MDDLKDTLRRKAEEQRAAEARKKMELETAATEIERAQEIIAEETRIAGLRDSITAIDSKVGEMQSLLTELEEAHAQAGASVAEAGQDRKKIAEATEKIEGVFADEEMREILASEGITSVEDLLESGEYQEQAEVKSIKALRASHPEKRSAVRGAVGARRQIKERAHQVIAGERPDATQKLTYKDIIAALKALIQELGRERQILFHQTPEGQEALRAEIKKRVEERHSYVLRVSKNDIPQYITVEASDIQDGAQYGEAAVKDALKIYYGEVIDAQCGEEAERAGVPQLEKIIQTIEALPSRWQEIRKHLGRAQTARQQIIYRLSELLGNDPNSPLFRLLNNYGRYGAKDAATLAEYFVNAYSGHNTAEAEIERIISAQETMMPAIQRGHLKELFSRTERQDFFGSYPVETKLENPERADILLSELEKFYRKFRDALTTPEATLAKMEGGDFTKEVEIRSQYDLGLRSEIKRMLEFDAETYVALRDTPLRDLKTRLELQRAEIARNAKKLEEQTADKVDVDWASSELASFLDAEGNRRIIQDVKRIVEMRGIAERLSPRLDTAAAQAEAYLDENVLLTQSGGLEFTRAPRKDIFRLNDEIEKITQKIQPLEAKIRYIEQRATIEGDGLFGGKRRKREKEKSALEAEKRPLEEQLKTLRGKLQPLNEMDEKLYGIISLLYDARQEGLAFTLQSPIALRKLIELLKQQMSFELTPEQSRVHEQYRELEKKRTEATKRYEKWSR